MPSARYCLQQSRSWRAARHMQGAAPVQHGWRGLVVAAPIASALQRRSPAHSSRSQPASGQLQLFPTLMPGAGLVHGLEEIAALGGALEREEPEKAHAVFGHAEVLNGHLMTGMPSVLFMRSTTRKCGMGTWVAVGVRGGERVQAVVVGGLRVDAKHRSQGTSRRQRIDICIGRLRLKSASSAAMRSFWLGC
jgi:hypothetical protein